MFTLDITSYLNEDSDTRYIAFKVKRPYNPSGTDPLKKTSKYVDLLT